jgi:putative transposase
MAWELKKVEDQRRQLVNLYFEGDLSVQEICNRFKVSRKTAYKWIHRYNEGGELALVDRSKAPFNPNKIYQQNIWSKAVEMKLRYPKWGPRKVLAKLQRENPSLDFPSERRMYDIFKEQGLITKRRIRKRVPATEALKDVHAPNDTWMGDFKGWFRTGNGEKCEPLTVTDGESRYVIKCLHVSKKTVIDVWLVLASAFHEYGLPQRFRTDNGPPFGSVGAGRLTKLSVNLIKAGVVPEWIEPGHPEQNGRHERFHLTLKEAVAMPPAQTLARQIRNMRDFVHEYNFERPHEALGLKTPAEVYGTSPRQWDGVLRSPDYNPSDGMLRKVSPGGTFWVKGTEYYLGYALSGEYVQFREGAHSDNVYYGSLLLGDFTMEKGFSKMKRKSRKSKS